MPRRVRKWRERMVMAWVVAGMVPFLLANACFDTSTAPDVVPPGKDSADTDTVTTFHGGFCEETAGTVRV